MFDIEKSIAEWRRRMLAAGIQPPKPLDELESHLRDDIRALVSAGEREDRAFELAVSRLGSPESVQTEFRKIKRAQSMPVKIGSLLWLAAVIMVAAGLSPGLFAGKLSLLLYAHILSVTAGYSAVLLMGGFGIFGVCWRRSHKLSPVREESLRRAVYWFSHIIVGLVIVGIMLGLFVSKQIFGRYWGWDPKEIGGLCVLAWGIALAAMQRFGQISARIAMLTCVGGNVIVSLAWFGAGIIDNNRRSGHGTGNWWPLAVFLGINVCFLMLDILPGHDRTEA